MMSSLSKILCSIFRRVYKDMEEGISSELEKLDSKW